MMVFGMILSINDYREGMTNVDIIPTVKMV